MTFLYGSDESMTFLYGSDEEIDEKSRVNNPGATDSGATTPAPSGAKQNPNYEKVTVTLDDDSRYKKTPSVPPSNMVGISAEQEEEIKEKRNDNRGKEDHGKKNGGRSYFWSSNTQSKKSQNHSLFSWRPSRQSRVQSKERKEVQTKKAPEIPSPNDVTPRPPSVAVPVIIEDKMEEDNATVGVQRTLSGRLMHRSNSKSRALKDQQKRGITLGTSVEFRKSGSTHDKKRGKIEKIHESGTYLIIFDHKGGEVSNARYNEFATFDEIWKEHLPSGSTVKLENLVKNEFALNEKIGEIASYSMSTGKFLVRLRDEDGSETNVEVSPKNLTKIDKRKKKALSSRFTTPNRPLATPKLSVTPQSDKKVKTSDSKKTARSIFSYPKKPDIDVERPDPAQNHNSPKLSEDLETLLRAHTLSSIGAVLLEAGIRTIEDISLLSEEELVNDVRLSSVLVAKLVSVVQSEMENRNTPSPEPPTKISDELLTLLNENSMTAMASHLLSANLCTVHDVLLRTQEKLQNEVGLTFLDAKKLRETAQRYQTAKEIQHRQNGVKLRRRGTFASSHMEMAIEAARVCEKKAEISKLDEGQDRSAGAKERKLSNLCAQAFSHSRQPFLKKKELHFEHDFENVLLAVGRGKWSLKKVFSSQFGTNTDITSVTMALESLSNFYEMSALIKKILHDCTEVAFDLHNTAIKIPKSDSYSLELAGEKIKFDKGEEAREVADIFMRLEKSLNAKNFDLKDELNRSLQVVENLNLCSKSEKVADL